MSTWFAFEPGPGQNGFSFFMPCVPPKTSHHVKKIVRFKMQDGREFTKLGDKAPLVEAKAMLDGLLNYYRPASPVVGPVVLDVTWVWPWLKSHSRKFRAAGIAPCDTTPDLSNVLKTLEDRLVRLRFIEDDKAVVRVSMQKFWGDTPGIGVRIQPFTMPHAISFGGFTVWTPPAGLPITTTAGESIHVRS